MEKGKVSRPSLFFEEFPTYEKLASGTPKLTFVFKVKEENLDRESQVVREEFLPRTQNIGQNTHLYSFLMI